MARLNKTRYALLGALSNGPASGYDIKIMMEQSTGHFWKESDASIYPILKQLLKEELVNLNVVNAESGKPKKVYAITDNGSHALHEWLLNDPDPSPNRNELLLKVFFGWNAKPNVTINHIKNFRHKVEVTLNKYLSSNLAKKASSITDLTQPELYRFLTLKAGIRYSESVLKWCDDALQLLTKNIKDKKDRRK